MRDSVRPVSCFLGAAGSPQVTDTEHKQKTQLPARLKTPNCHLYLVEALEQAPKGQKFYIQERFSRRNFEF